MFLTYLAIGLVLNFLTMIDRDIREGFFELGLVGFVLQMILSTIFWPFIAKALLEDFFELFGKRRK